MWCIMDNLNETNEKEIKSRPSKKKLLVIIPLCVVVFIAVCAAVVFAWFAVEYNEAYEPVDIVERSDTYQLPDYPDISIGSDSVPPTDAPKTDAPVTTTEEPVTVAPVTTDVTLPPETEAPVTTEIVTTAPQTTDPWRPPAENFDKDDEDTEPAVSDGADTTEPEPVVTYPPIQYDSNASFANSDSIVSIYSSIPIYKVAQKNSNIMNLLLIFPRQKICLTKLLMN